MKILEKSKNKIGYVSVFNAKRWLQQKTKLTLNFMKKEKMERV